MTHCVCKKCEGWEKWDGKCIENGKDGLSKYMYCDVADESGRITTFRKLRGPILWPPRKGKEMALAEHLNKIWGSLTNETKL